MSDETLPLEQGQNEPHEEPAFTPAAHIGLDDTFWMLKGRHVGRTIHAFADVRQIILLGVQLDKDVALLPDSGIEQYPVQTRLQYKVYNDVLRLLPYLAAELSNKTIDTDWLDIIDAFIKRGIGAARSDDVKGVKAAIVVWITDPEKGLVPPIDPTIMAGRGFNHEATGKELCPAGLDWNDPSIKSALKAGTMVVHSDQWPIFFYLNGNYDPERPWIGFLRGRLLVNAFKHVFTSPSSVNDSGRSTKSSNSALHSMTKVTEASLTYVATIVRFALGSRLTFTRKDTVTDSQTFYNVLLAFLTHPDERENVNELLAWWNQQVFPYAVAIFRAPTANGALAKLMEAQKKRLALQAIGANASG